MLLVGKFGCCFQPGSGVKINRDPRKREAAWLENAAGGEMRSITLGP